MLGSLLAAMVSLDSTTDPAASYLLSSRQCGMTPQLFLGGECGAFGQKICSR